ncbi:MAG: HlyD family efflux transporter periplasmic adaptor subunit [Bacillota bacterium]|jgi:putative membrane fusion protein
MKQPRVEDHSLEERARRFYARTMVVALALVFATGVLTFVRPLWVGRFAPSEVAASGSLKVEIEGQALMIRNERLAVSPASGVIRLVADNGQRVAAGDIVAEILPALSEPDLPGLPASQPSAASSSRTDAAGRAIAVLRARQSCVVSYHMDGLEEAMNASHPDILDITPGSYQPEPRRTSDGDVVRAGQAVFREITDLRTELLFFADLDDEELRAGRSVRVRFPRLAQEEVNATVLDVKSRPDLGEGWHAVRIALDRFALTLADLRLERAILIPRTIQGIIVPASSVVERDGYTGVYIYRAGRYVFRPVILQGVVGSRAAVSGIREGDKVLLKP